MASSKTPGNGAYRPTKASALTQKDADRFKTSARTYTKDATVSKDKARETLVRLGIYTRAGNLTKNYG